MKGICYSFIATRLLIAAVLLSARATGQETYFVTYDQHLEEPGNLEVSINPLIGKPPGGNAFVGSWMEFEYGATGWWTMEFYLDGQSTRRESTLFTGYRWENRFRPLAGEHWINPVFYVEFENVHGSDKILKDVVGFDSREDFGEPNAETHGEREREIETKLILGSQYRGWNISENFIAAKSFSNEPWEFGYALGVSRPLGLAATPRPCVFCRENFHAGLELYGGLGDAHSLTLRGTSHYLAPVLAWELANGTAMRISPTFGITGQSFPFLVRVGVSYEVAGFGRQVRRMFR